MLLEIGRFTLEIVGSRIYFCIPYIGEGFIPLSRKIMSECVFDSWATVQACGPKPFDWEACLQEEQQP